MLRQFSDIRNFALAALDGEIGKIKELYFDDQFWIVRYAVVNTRGWLTGRKVLIGPHAFGLIDEHSELIAVHLTRQQIEGSPSIDEDKPVSRQHEEEWHRYYGYQGYWLGSDLAALGAMPIAVPRPVEYAAGESGGTSKQAHGDPHLRSTSEVLGYSIHATDGDVGRVDDFILDDEGWAIRYIVVSRSWWPGKKVIVSPEWIERVSWEQSRVFVPLNRETIKDAPEWDGTWPLPRAFEERLHDYYGRHGYWPVMV